MTFYILTVFPEMFESVFSASILGRAVQNDLIRIRLINIRDYAEGKHRNTDDYPYGGGAGMLMMAQPIASAVKAVREDFPDAKSAPLIYLSPKGKTYCQRIARELSGMESMILLCGHYEGVDQRVIDKYVDMEISVGDYVLTGGEVAAMAVVESVSRLIPGVLGSDESAADESFSGDSLEYPQYTRPRVFEGMAVPEVLLNGNHAEIEKWRREQSRLITRERRPDLIAKQNDAEGDEEK